MDLCGECSFVDLHDCMFEDRYYCKKIRKRIKLDDKACYSFLKRNNNQSNFELSGCYITTIVCNILGYKDNCTTLTILREFRDKYLKKHEEYKELLSEYNIVGPYISKCITEEQNNLGLAIELYQSFLIPAIIYIKNKDFDNAIKCYVNMVTLLKIRYNIMLGPIPYYIEKNPVLSLN